MLKPAAAPAPAKPVVTPARRPLGSADVMRSLGNEMDRLFGDFGLRRRWPFAFLASERDDFVWSPEVEVEEREGKLFVRADLPGMAREDVKVEVTEDALTLEGERRHTEEKKEQGYYRTERSYGRFSRTIALPEGVDVSTATAGFKNGVLEIAMALPKPATAPARKLDIS